MVDQTVSENPTTPENLDAQLTGELDITVTELMDEVAARVRHSRSALPPGAFTIRQYMQHHDVTEWVARRALKNQVEAGFLLTEKTALSGRGNVCIWWRNPDHVATS